MIVELTDDFFFQLEKLLYVYVPWRPAQDGTAVLVFSGGETYEPVGMRVSDVRAAIRKAVKQ